MKTIDERAEEYANECWTLAVSNFACEDGYIKGATDQREIDIEDIFNHVGQYLRNNILSCIIDQGSKRILELDTLMANMIDDYKNTKVYTAKGTYHKKKESNYETTERDKD